MSSWTVIGHRFITEALDSYLERASVPHAFLFAGPDGVGKRTVAEEFLKKLLGVVRLDTHPDVHLLDASAADFDIDAARRFMNSLNVKPFLGPYTVGIIDNAQALNAQSGNALLKTLEEPNPGTVLILVATSATLLPTIVSRCQVYSFGRLSDTQLAAYISGSGLPAEDWMVTMAAGAPGRLATFASDPEYAGRVRAVTERLSLLASSSVAERLAAVPDLAELDDVVLNTGLVASIYQIRNELTHRPQRYRTLAALMNTLRKLDLHLNKKMVLERLCLDL